MTIKINIYSNLFLFSHDIIPTIYHVETRVLFITRSKVSEKTVILDTEVWKTGGYFLLHKVIAYEALEHKFPTTPESQKAIWLLGKDPC